MELHVFDEVIDAAIVDYDNKMKLKDQQRKCLQLLCASRSDLIVNLPVGYGKSIIYHLLPFVYRRIRCNNSPVVIVVSPLNIIQFDQVSCLKEHNISVCRLNIKCIKINSDDEISTEAAMHDIDTDSDLEDVRTGKYAIVLTHPEALLNTRKGCALLNDSKFQKLVEAVVIDECHLIDVW
jgi:superfamily II DNA helicase RecQ